MGHGSFIIFGRNALDTLFPVFNEKMFLYNEELYLGLRAKQLNIPIYFIPSLRVLHMEGASAGYVYSKQFPLYRESYFSMVNSDLNSSAI
jgi:GT2 family glycosyltransferase